MAYNNQNNTAWLICTACGTQYPTADRQEVKTCFICDDPRQFTPLVGQSFTTLDDLRSRHKNTFTPVPGSEGMLTSIVTEPKVAIGQRAILIKTPLGNVLWDCITLLDDATVERIQKLGGLKAIVISHPHYYSTHLEWARAFSCPVYFAAEDQEWLAQRSEQHQICIEETEFDLKIDEQSSGVVVLRLGGHFPGSLVALYESRLLIADTLVTTPSGQGNWDTDAVGNARSRPAGMNTFVFMWSIPNMIPLSPDEIQKMWRILKKYEFERTHGAFLGTDIIKTVPEMRKRVLESMQIQIQFMGHIDHALLQETVDR